ncbi:unnamed protein product, partial [Nesidiocoris tenuis]
MSLAAMGIQCGPALPPADQQNKGQTQFRRIVSKSKEHKIDNGDELSNRVKYYPGFTDRDNERSEGTTQFFPTRNQKRPRRWEAFPRLLFPTHGEDSGTTAIIAIMRQDLRRKSSVSCSSTLAKMTVETWKHEWNPAAGTHSFH